MVAKNLLEDIMPRYALSLGPALISQVTQSLVKILGTDWKLHCAHCPQSSEQVERMNRSLKETLTKHSGYRTEDLGGKEEGLK